MEVFVWDGVQERGAVVGRGRLQIFIISIFNENNEKEAGKGPF